MVLSDVAHLAIRANVSPVSCASGSTLTEFSKLILLHGRSCLKRMFLPSSSAKPKGRCSSVVRAHFTLTYLLG